MKKFTGLLAFTLTTFLVSQSSFAMGRARQVQQDVMVLNAAYRVGHFCAYVGVSGANISSEEVKNAAKNETYLALGWGRDYDVYDYINPAKLVSKAGLGYSWYVPIRGLWLKVEGYARAEDGFRDAFNIPMLDAQGNKRDWFETMCDRPAREAAQEAFAKGLSGEEIGKAASRATIQLFEEYSEKINQSVNERLESQYMADNVDFKQVITLLKKIPQSASFKNTIPEYQAFVIRSIENIERKVLTLGL